uniref:Transforming growth factor beta-like protein n=1 Tax=Parastrongyloides trichosuri TaxID=131310 RepID=A0A0N4ZDQ0_PARTI
MKKYYLIIIVLSIFFTEGFTSSTKWYDDPEKSRVLNLILQSFGLDKPIPIEIPFDNLLSVTRNIKNSFHNPDEDDKNKKYLQIEPISYKYPFITFRNIDLMRSNNIKSISLTIEYIFDGIFEEPINANVLLLIDEDNIINEDIGKFMFDGVQNDDLNKIHTLKIPLNLTTFTSAVSKRNDYVKFIINFKETHKPVIIKLKNVYLDVVAVDSNERVKRNNDRECINENKKKTCCVKKTEINFDEIGWNFIVAPKTLQAQFCHGDCVHATNNLLLGGVLNKIGNDNEIPHRSCCFPTEYIPLNISIFKNGMTVETRTLNNLLAKRCSCY